MSLHSIYGIVANIYKQIMHASLILLIRKCCAYNVVFLSPFAILIYIQ